MKKVLLGLSVMATSASLLASNVSIIDSGSDFRNEKIKSQAWLNSKESPNGQDDEKNGKIDDLFGWNFSANNNKVYDPTGLEKLSPAIYTFMEVVARIELKAMTAEDKAFIEKVKALPKDKQEKFFNQANWYGQHAHGTHVAGIVANNKFAKLSVEKVFPDNKTPDAPDATFIRQFGFTGKAFDLIKNIFQMATLRFNKDAIYKQIGDEEAKLFGDVASYAKEKAFVVGNMSLGLNVASVAHEILMKTDLMYAARFMTTQKKDMAKLSKESQKGFAAMKASGNAWLNQAPGMLFVIAAANDAQDNDALPVYPANLETNNSITVAATNGYKELASFSDYGANTVHVAAPGVAVMSSVPHATDRTKMLPMSGTSMAAPFVSMVASGVLDVNPSLTPVQVKAILMGTVDVKAWLKGKVRTSGIVNAARAVEAAKLTKSMSLEAAVAQARTHVGDLPEVGAVVPGTRGVRVPVTADLSAIARKFAF